MTLQVVFISSEVFPFAKSGGLGDVAGALPVALEGLGIDVTCILPKYRSVGEGDLERLPLKLRIGSGTSTLEAAVWEGRLDARVPVYLLDIPELYDRPGLYGHGGRDHPDNCRRFAALSRGAFELLAALERAPDVLHAHDWQTALVPLYSKTLHADEPTARRRTVLTIHNLAYQGVFDAAELSVIGLGAELFEPRVLEYYGRVNLLKGGIVGADALTTVSPRYAREILTPEFGHGLDGVLRDRSEDLMGILNGIDVEAWDPRSDPALPTRYGPDDLSGKGRCKRALLAELGLPAEGDVPLFGVVSRLVAQKGLDLLVETLRGSPVRDARPGTVEGRWVVLGTGDADLEEALAALAEERPERLAFVRGFDEALAHRIQAGCDFLCMPSRYEPCGLNQLYALRYGTVPVVHRVGGLADTVVDVDADPEGGTGIVFDTPSAAALAEALRRAVRLYGDAERWAELRPRIMRIDHSWRRSARAYVELYEGTLSRPAAPLPGN